VYTYVLYLCINHQPRFMMYGIYGIILCDKKSNKKNQRTFFVKFICKIIRTYNNRTYFIGTFDFFSRLFF